MQATLRRQAVSDRDYFFVQLTIVAILVTMIVCKVIVLRPEWFGEVAR